MGQEERRKLIIDKWKENIERPIHFIAKDLKMPRTTVNNVLNQYFQTFSIQRKKTLRTKTGPRCQILEKKIVQVILKNRSMSVRDIAKKCQTTHSMVQRCKLRKGLQTRKKRKAAKVSESQKKTIKTRSRKLYDLLGKKSVCIVMDDETYVKADFRTLPGEQFYTAFKGEELLASQTSICLEKFGTKYLVWQAICQCGLKSSSFITTGTINGEIYREECLKKILIPFIKNHTGSTIFWPDLASAHYARSTLKLLDDNNIEYVKKDFNPPNVPQCRPIERYWAIIKSKLRKSGAVAHDKKEFIEKWKNAANNISQSTVRNLMQDIRKKVRNEWTKK